MNGIFGEVKFIFLLKKMIIENEIHQSLLFHL